MKALARSRRDRLPGAFGSLALPGPDQVHGWGQYRWHQEKVNAFPEALSLYDDVPRLFRDHILGGHVPSEPLLTETDTVVTLGSCFAQELREVLELARFGSSSVWVPSGLNNTFALLDFVSWATTGSTTNRAFRYERSAEGEIVEWEAGQKQAAYQEYFLRAGAFVFTLGLAEVWVDRETDQVFWRGVPEHIFDEQRHEFRLTTVAENERNILEIIRHVRAANPRAPIVLTLSPVPLQATFREISCMTADCVSKSVLRVALDAVMSSRPDNVYYWPSFELVKWAGPAFDWRAYEQDARHVHRYLVECIVTAFVESFYGSDAALVLQDRLREGGQKERPPHRARLRLNWIAHQPRRARNKLTRELATFGARAAGRRRP